jgi:glycosyltransferase involved in cell wall biosynthesis
VTRVLLVGPRGHGGEEVYVRSIVENAPPGVEYVRAGSFHEGAPGAPCRRVEEVLLNRLVHPLVIPDMGFRAFALRERFDLVHVHAHPVRLSRRGTTPLVMSEGSSSAVYLQDYLGWSDVRLERAYARARRVYQALGIHDRLLNLERVSRAYVFSRWARDLNVRWGADPQKLDVVYPGFPTPKPVDRRGRDTFTFLFVGTDFERKGGFEVVEAFAEVAGTHAQARLMLVCPDPALSNPDRAIHSWVAPARRERVLARLREMEAAGTVTRRPLLPQPALYAEAYPAADAFVMPSHAEGFGFTNVEALSFGLPVVSSTVGAIPETVTSGGTGVLVPPGDVGALAAAMGGLLADPARAGRLGEAGRADFLARFTRERFRSELARVYGQALRPLRESPPSPPRGERVG